MKPTLSPAQAKFASEVASHGNLSKAYRAAYPASSSWMEKSVNQVASRMMTNVKIATRVAELRAKSEAKLGLSRETWLARWVELTSDCPPDETVIRALENLGKAMGYYAPDRHEHTVSGSVDQTIRVVGIEARIAAVIAMSERHGVVLPPVELLAIGDGEKKVENSC